MVLPVGLLNNLNYLINNIVSVNPKACVPTWAIYVGETGKST
ncbi:hypothetical protein C2W64_01980 [Brevibacillus laterosporus]|nr:hypothetical protein C2W64_01980 [Brevibacillus laterosporus]